MKLFVFVNVSNAVVRILLVSSCGERIYREVGDYNEFELQRSVITVNKTEYVQEKGGF